MNCQRIDALLDGHAVTALSAAERSEVDSHLESCPRCADAWLSHEILTRETPVAPRSGLLDETLARAMAGAGGAAGSRTAHRRLVSTFGLAATALVALGLAGWLLPDTKRVTGAGTRSR
jgi:anti-sigma factor RsiW